MVDLFVILFHCNLVFEYRSRVGTKFRYVHHHTGLLLIDYLICFYVYLIEVFLSIFGWQDYSNASLKNYAVWANSAVCCVLFSELKALLHTVPEVARLIGAKNTDLVLRTSDQDDEGKVKAVL
ncbi:hypothetical protein S245_067739 [Arachis hypogaea]|uniref:Mannose-6-phosphate isomerase n=1 Tax=Arachis hypogaea TaxID=3818 RepID=A0A6B9VBD1_ARAHY|nr:Mannose-6-phosphate isomerase [Arachis hypogaea]